MPVFPGRQDSLQSACASSPSLALSPVTAWGVVYPAFYHLSLKPVLHWRGGGIEPPINGRSPTRRVASPISASIFASLLQRDHRQNSATYAPTPISSPVFPDCQTETPRFRLAVTTAITTSWLGVDRSGLPTTSDCSALQGAKRRPRRIGAACWNRTSTSGGGRNGKPSSLHLTTMPHVCPSFRAAISALLNFI